MSSRTNTARTAARAVNRAEAAADKVLQAAIVANEQTEAVNSLTKELIALTQALQVDRNERQKREETERNERQNRDETERNEALKKRPLFNENLEPVHRSFRYWSDRLHNAGLQLNVGIVAANWALWGNLNAIATNYWAKVSLGAVGVGLGIDLIGSFWLSALNFYRIYYAEKDKIRWQNLAKASWEDDKNYHSFPFTRTNEVLGFILRFLKVVLPILGMVALIIGANKIRQEQRESNPRESIKPAMHGLHFVGELTGFGSGDTVATEPALTAFKNSQWRRALLSDTLNTLSYILIGNVDKQPLRGDLHKIYGSNEALALARARVVKRMMLSAVSHERREALDQRILILSSSAAHVGLVVDSTDLAKDRSVIVYSLNGRSETESSVVKENMKRKN